MEYGLMLGFNKYVIPFQRESQKLPFNVAGLDTIKYSNANFENKAEKSINQAIKKTQQDNITEIIPDDQVLKTYLLTKKMLYSNLTSEGEINLFDIGVPLGFNLLNDFGGLNYAFWGNFTLLRPEVIIWRLNILKEILDERLNALPAKLSIGIGTEKEKEAAELLLKNLQIWVLVTSESDKETISETIDLRSIGYKTIIYSLDDIKQ